jgi:hypothetical protein
MTLEDSLKLLLIDKLLIGGILLLLGLFATWKIERFKTKQSLEAALNQIRVAKIGDCWAVHSKYVMLLNAFIDSLNKLRVTDLTDEQIICRLTPHLQELKDTKEEVELVTASNRFWLGDEIHQKAVAFNKSFPDFCDVFNSGKFKRCVELKMDMENEMIDVDEVMRMLNEKILKSKRNALLPYKTATKKGEK